MIERVFRYLRGTQGLGIFFDERRKLKAYADFNYDGVKSDMISTSGILIDHCGPIVWIAQKQSITSISSVEAEYRAAVRGIQEICWIHRIIKELNIESLTGPLVYRQQGSNAHAHQCGRRKGYEGKETYLNTSQIYKSAC